MEPDCGSTRGVGHFGKAQRFPDTANSRLTVGLDGSFGPAFVDIGVYYSSNSVRLESAVTFFARPLPLLFFFSCSPCRTSSAYRSWLSFSRRARTSRRAGSLIV